MILRSSSMELIAFRLRGQEFSVPTTSIREIRGWSPCTPIPRSPPEILGIMNLRGRVIPIIDLARTLGMSSISASERSAVVVTEVHDMVLGLLVEEVSDILTADATEIQPVPEMTATFDPMVLDGIVTKGKGMICLLNLPRMFPTESSQHLVA